MGHRSALRNYHDYMLTRPADDAAGVNDTAAVDENDDEAMAALKARAAQVNREIGGAVEWKLTTLTPLQPPNLKGVTAHEDDDDNDAVDCATTRFVKASFSTNRVDFVGSTGAGAGDDSSAQRAGSLPEFDRIVNGSRNESGFFAATPANSERLQRADDLADLSPLYSMNTVRAIGLQVVHL